MVSTRSSNVTGARRSGKKREASSAETQKLKSKQSSRKLPRTPKSQNVVSRIASKSLAAANREDFLESLGVHTRSEGPVPEISLSTELPDSLPNPTAEPKCCGKRRSRGSRAVADLEQTADEARVLRGSKADAAAEIVSSEGEEEPFGRESEVESDEPPVGDSDSYTEAARSAEIETIPATAGPTPQQKAEDELPEDEFDSHDESDSDKDPLGPSKHRTTDKAHKATTKRSSHETAAVGEGLEWRPETKLPGPLQSAETEVQAKAAVQETGLSKQLLAPPRDARLERKSRKEAQEQQREWHDLPVTPITDEVKRDLQLLRLRGAMDTKRFYKKGEKGRFPTRFAIGTVVEGPTDFYSGRLVNKKRKQTITEELLADHDMRESQKRRFDKLQEEKSRWSHKKHKGSGERLKKRAKRPKH